MDAVYLAASSQRTHPTLLTFPKTYILCLLKVNLTFQIGNLIWVEIDFGVWTAYL